MYKILVPVDFSANSRKSIRFALQLASQIKAEVILFHVVGMLLPSSEINWSYSDYSEFQKEDAQKVKERLIKLVQDVSKNNLFPAVKYSSEIVFGDNVSDSIISYAKAHHIDFICVGARGTGFLAKLFGNIATELITNSPLPLFIIPKDYRHKPLSDICYASDLKNLTDELKKVTELAKSMTATVKVLHFEMDYELLKSKSKFAELAKRHENQNVKFEYRELNIVFSLSEHLNKEITKFKPSFVVLFTKQNRNWLDRLLLPSQSTDLSFTSKVPLLLYRKTNKKKTESSSLAIKSKAHYNPL